MKKKRGGLLVIVLAAVMVLGVASVTWAAVDRVVTVPW